MKSSTIGNFDSTKITTPQLASALHETIGVEKERVQLIDVRGKVGGTELTAIYMI